jgi:thiol-disulfide isomerase/thioredoxin
MFKSIARVKAGLLWILLFAGIFSAQAQYHMLNDSILEGKISQKELAQNYHWFTERKSAYIPDDSTLKELHPFVKDLSFIVVMGTWCSDSREHIPPFFKLMEKLGIKDKKIELIGVDRKKQTTAMDIAPLYIEYVPTFIVFYKRKEVGRIIEDTRVSLEKDLLHILSAQ